MSFERPWIYSTNPMLSVTADSYRLSLRISTFHLERLQTKAGTPVYDALIDQYTPLHTQLAKAYAAWKGQGGSQLGQTLDLNNLLLLLRNSKIKKWDIAIQNVYDNTTSTYKTLLPNKRAPFQNGKQEDILSAVEVLRDTIKTQGKLQAVYDEVEPFFDDLKKAYDSQKQSIGDTSLLSGALEKARVAMCVGQYANLGAIIQANATDSDAICYFFDQLALREGTQVIYTGSTKPSACKNILVHTFATGDELKLEGDDSLTEQWFYLASQKDSKPVSDKVIKVAAGQSLTVPAEALGDLASRYLMVYNPSTDMKGEWTVEFI